jgi:prepilin-type N-terminal cleavage/methylation domain-containing protein
MKKITSQSKSLVRRLLPSAAKGFTIVELLITIAIIALLTGIVMTSLTPAKSKARDAKRISDLVNVQAALELYFDRCKEYPLGTNGWLDTAADNGCPPDINLGTYITVIPSWPTAGGNSYLYTTQENLAKPDAYILETVLENYNEVLKDDIDGEDSSTFDHECGSNVSGNAERVFCLGPK